MSVATVELRVTLGTSVGVELYIGSSGTDVGVLAGGGTTIAVRVGSGYSGTDIPESSARGANIVADWAVAGTSLANSTGAFGAGVLHAETSGINMTMETVTTKLRMIDPSFSKYGPCGRELPV